MPSRSRTKPIQRLVIRTRVSESYPLSAPRSSTIRSGDLRLRRRSSNGFISGGISLCPVHLNKSRRGAGCHASSVPRAPTFETPPRGRARVESLLGFASSLVRGLLLGPLLPEMVVGRQSQPRAQPARTSPSRWCRPRCVSGIDYLLSSAGWTAEESSREEI